MYLLLSGPYFSEMFPNYTSLCNATSGDRDGAPGAARPGSSGAGARGEGREDRGGTAKDQDGEGRGDAAGRSTNQSSRHTYLIGRGKTRGEREQRIERRARGGKREGGRRSRESSTQKGERRGEREREKGAEGGGGRRLPHARQASPRPSLLTQCYAVLVFFVRASLPFPLAVTRRVDNDIRHPARPRPLLIPTGRAKLSVFVDSGARLAGQAGARAQGPRAARAARAARAGHWAVIRPEQMPGADPEGEGVKGASPPAWSQGAPPGI